MTLRAASLIIGLLVASSAPVQTPVETPAAAALRIRREDAEKRALFQSLEPLAFTLEGKFSALARDRDPESKNAYPGVIRLAGLNNTTTDIPVELSPRGNLRRQSCQFVPLRVA